MSANHRHVPTVWANVLKGLVIMMAGYIAYHSLSPTSAPKSINHIDKLVHATVYCALAFVMAGGWRRSTLLFVFLVTAAFGAALEVGQGLMNMGRTASFADQVANMVGAGLGCGTWTVIAKRYRRKRIET